MSRLLTHAARCSESIPTTIGYTLAAHRRRTGLDDGALAAYLGCPAEALPRLALCRRPDPSSPRPGPLSA
jgi:hypothetical protein